MVASIEELLRVCREEQLQSLIVEGGRQTLQSFIDSNLWDEIRVETAPLCVGEGTPVPALPDNIVLKSKETYDGNTIQVYTK